MLLIFPSVAEKNFYVRTDDLCLLSYLRGRKYDVEKAFKMMQNTYKLRLKKSFYDAEDNVVVHDVFKQNYVGFLPYRAKNGSVILVVKLGELSFTIALKVSLFLGMSF